jgi:hypothetical protein
MDDQADIGADAGWLSLELPRSVSSCDHACAVQAERAATADLLDGGGINAKPRSDLAHALRAPGLSRAASLGPKNEGRNRDGVPGMHLRIPQARAAVELEISRPSVAPC